MSSLKERKQIYSNKDYSVGEDGVLYNPSDVPLRNIIYELALSLHKSQVRINQMNDALANKTEEIKNLKYMLYENFELSHNEFKMNYTIANLQRKISSQTNRFKHELNKLKEELERCTANDSET